jgi:acetyl-CoA C-acetyltransferase
MSTLATDTWIVGCGEAPSSLSRDDVSITEFAWEAIKPALDEAGTRLADIEGGVTASQDFWDGRTISSMSVNELAGGTLRSEAKIASDACQALGYALARVQDGDQHLNVVVAHAKESQADSHTIELAAFDPYFERQLDPDDTIVAAFQAQQLYARGAITQEHGARVVAAARSRSSFLDPVSADDVLASAPTAAPLRELDRAPLVDAASAIIICDGPTADSLGKPRVRLAGASSRTAAYWRQRADLCDASAAAEAMDDALAVAGWQFSDLDHIEINTPFAHQSLMVAAALGLGEGDGAVARFEGNGNGHPAHPVLNASGAWLGGSAGSVAGLHSVVSLVRTLRDTPGRALVHSTSGLGAQSHHIILLEATA